MSRFSAMEPDCTGRLSISTTMCRICCAACASPAAIGSTVGSRRTRPASSLLNSAQSVLDYVCVSSGGISPRVRPAVAPGYQVPLAAAVKKVSGIAVQAVGMIVSPHPAEAIIAGGQADFVALAGGFLDDPRWGWHAAAALGADAVYPPQHRRARPEVNDSSHQR